MSDIRDLVESYYNDVYIEEEQLDEMGQTGGNSPGGSRPITNAPYQSRFARPRNANTTVRNSATDEVLQKPKISSLPTDLKRTELSATASGQRAAGRVGGGNAGASTNVTPVKPVTAPARPLPAGNPNLNVKVTAPAPGGAGKVAPTAPAKPTGSAMDQWRAANPKLAAAADEKARIRGTQQTDNPLMKDMRSRLPMNSPSVQSPDVAKLGAGNQSLTQNPNAFKAATPAPSTPSTTTTKPQTTPKKRDEPLW